MKKKIVFAVLTAAGIVLVLAAAPLGIAAADLRLSLSGGMAADKFQFLAEGYIRSLQILGALCAGTGILKMMSGR